MNNKWTILFLFIVLPICCFSQQPVPLDNIPPVAVCETYHIVSLNSFTSVVVNASVFDDGSHDETCLGEFKVRRMTEPETAFKSTITFHCQDACNPDIMVVMRVYDCSGNFNDCMVLVTVVDKISPVLNCGQPDTILCGIDPLPFLSKPTVQDACTYTLSFSDQNLPGMCNMGCYQRTWKAIDKCGNEGVCYDKVYYKYKSSWEVDFPADVTVAGCKSPDDLKNLGTPKLIGVDCELVGIEKIDEVIPVSDDACYLISRHWKLVEWCTFDDTKPKTNLGIKTGPRKYKDDGDGFFYYTQTIRVRDNIPPILNCKDTTYCIPDNACALDFTIKAPKVTDCSNEISYFLTSTLGSQWDVKQVKAGNYALTFTVLDGCGNQNQCISKIKVKDCTPPSAICYSELYTVLMPSTEMVSLWGKELLKQAVDNCTPSDQLLIKVIKADSSDHKSPPSSDVVNFYCKDAGKVIPVEVWVGDGNGNWIFCTTNVGIQDNSGSCDSMMNINIMCYLMGLEPQKDIQLKSKDNVMNNKFYSSSSGLIQVSTLKSQGLNYYLSWNQNKMLPVTLKDIYKMYQIIKDPTNYDPLLFHTADINNDSVIDESDIQLAEQIYVGNISYEEYQKYIDFFIAEDGKELKRVDAISPDEIAKSSINKFRKIIIVPPGLVNFALPGVVGDFEKCVDSDIEFHIANHQIRINHKSEFKDRVVHLAFPNSMMSLSELDWKGWNYQIQSSGVTHCFQYQADLRQNITLPKEFDLRNDKNSSNETGATFKVADQVCTYTFSLNQEPILNEKLESMNNSCLKGMQDIQVKITDPLGRFILSKKVNGMDGVIHIFNNYNHPMYIFQLSCETSTWILSQVQARAFIDQFLLLK